VFFHQFSVDNFTEALVVAIGRLLFFSRLEVSFHGLHFAVIFTGRKNISRIISRIFSRVGPSFHGNKVDFFHGLKKSSRGKRITQLHITHYIYTLYINCYS